MTEYGGKNRMIIPVLSLLFVTFVSFLGYFGSRDVDSDTIHQLMAKIFGSAYFLSIAFGPLYIFTTGYIRGVSLPRLILASFVVPFVWMSKEVLSLTESHPILECLYWYFNPLNVGLVSMMVMEMGLATLIARAILKQKGRLLRVVTPAPIAVILGGLLLVLSGYVWGKGENVYVIFLVIYRFFFGSGIQ
jgi:hypothetical protein